jgi:hypothetical protein
VSSGVGRDWYGWASNRLCDHNLNPSHTSYVLANEDGTEYSITSAFKLQMLVNNPEESIQQWTYSS